MSAETPSDPMAGGSDSGAVVPEPAARKPALIQGGFRTADRVTAAFRVLRRGVPGPARTDEAQPPGSLAKVLLFALVAVPVVVNAVALLPELLTRAPSLNDDAFHYLLVGRASDALASGQNPLDFWVPQLELGFPQFLYYQNLPHLAVVAFERLLLNSADPLVLFNWVRYLLLVGLPVTVYWSMRRMGFSMVAAAISAAASSLLSADARYGFEFDSYVWRGLGMFTQLWAMHLSFIALACVHRALESGKGYVPAILALAALALCHLVYAYMMAITVLIVLLVGARRHTILPRAARLAIVGGVAVVASAYMWLPFLSSSQYLSVSPYLQSWKYDSLGAPTILGWLFSGDLLDHGRLPVLTLLLGLGIVAAALRRGRLALLALAGFVVWLVLYFGRPTLGPLVDLFPMHDGLLIHRFIGFVDLFATILMGIGGAWAWSWFRRLRRPWYPVVAFVVLLGVLAPALAERVAYYADNTRWMTETRQALDADTDIQAILAKLQTMPGGRTYAGLRANWGAQMSVGYVKVTDLLTFAAIPAVSPPYQSLSLNSDLIWSFKDGDRSQYDLFDVRYAIVPSSFTVPGFYTAIQKTARYTLYQVPTSGAAEYVALADRRSAPTQRALFDANLAWLNGPDPAAKRFIRWDYMAPVGSFTPTSGCPGGGKTLREVDESNAVHVVVECPADAALAIKVTYHPNWKVTVDGQPVEAFMVSPSYVGINLAAGRHSVDAVYEATPSKLPLLLLGLAALVAAVLLRRRLDRFPQQIAARTRGWRMVRPGSLRPPTAASSTQAGPTREPPVERPVGPPPVSDAAPAPQAPGPGSSTPLAAGSAMRVLADPTVLLALVLVAALGLGAWNLGRSSAQADFFYNWALGRQVTSGVTDIYSNQARAALGQRIYAETQAGPSSRARSAAELERAMIPKNTPFLFSVTGVLSTGDYDLDSGLWQLAGLAALLAAVLALCRLFGYTQAGSLVAAAVVLAASGPLFSDIRTGNMNQIQVGMLALFLVLRGRWTTARGDWVAGVLLGLAVAFKPDVAFALVSLGLLWLVDRRLATLARQVAGMAVGAAAAVAVATIIWRTPQPWLDWVGSVPGWANSARDTVATGNYALTQLLVERSGLNAAAPLAILLIGAIALAMLLGARGRGTGQGPLHRHVQRELERETLAMGAGIAVMLLAYPVAWLHYFTLLVPVLLFHLRPGDVGQPASGILPRQWLAALAVVLFFFQPIVTLMAGPADPAAYAVSAILGTAILLALALAGLAAGTALRLRGLGAPESPA